MPLDPMMSDAILNTFRNMVQECKDKEITGKDFEKMCFYMDRLEQLAQEHDDINVFNGQVMQENLYMKFSDHYGRALSEKAFKDQEEKGYDDSTLLKQMVDALKDAVQRLIDGKQEAIDLANSYDPNEAIDQQVDYIQRNSSATGISISKWQAKQMKKAAKKDIENALNTKPNMNNNSHEIDVLINHEPIIEAIEKLIALGEKEGMTTPRFLRIQIETGMDKAMEGTSLLRDRFEYDLEWANAMAVSPYHIKKAEDKIAMYDALAKISKFNLPNTDELNFCEEKIEYQYEPEIIRWDEITDRWDDLLYDLSHWSMSYCSIAPSIDPWAMAANPRKAVKNTQNIQPGIFKERERLFEKYFGLTFMDVFKHPTFEWQVLHHTIGYSQEYIEFLIEKVYPQCKPHNDLDRGSTQQRQAFYEQKKEGNPEYAKPLLKFIAFYDKKFGEGRYLSKYSGPEIIERNAAPWNWESFKYKE